jgi:hypothetical protein
VTATSEVYGWNGKETSDNKVNATVLGCGPAVKGKLKHAKGSRPDLTITTTKHPDAPNMKELEVTLSDNLSLSKSRIDRGGVTASAGESLEFVSRHKFKVTGLASAGASKVVVRLRNGAVRVSKHSRNKLKNGHSRRFSVKVNPTPVSGKGTATKTKFRVKP